VAKHILFLFLKKLEYKWKGDYVDMVNLNYSGFESEVIIETTIFR